MPIPVRTQAADYHYHVYDYNGAQAWVATPQGGANNNLYSLLADLQGVVAQGNGVVPNIAMIQAAENINSQGRTFNTIGIRLGNRANNPACPVTVITGGVHAREWIAPEMAYLLAEYLVKNYEAGPNYTSRYAHALSRIIDTRLIYIIPMLNPSGNYFTVFGPQPAARDWRKNRRAMPGTLPGWQRLLLNQGAANRPLRNVIPGIGTTFSYQSPYFPATAPLTYYTANINYGNAYIGVDINRNMNTPHWGYVADRRRPETNPPDDAYFGTNRNSEPEARNLINLLNGVNVNSSIDYHSYGQLILYPHEVATTPRMQNLGMALQRLIAASNDWSFSYNYSIGGLGYGAVSTVQDYMAARKNSTAFTIELDPTSDDIAFELPENQIQTVFEKNIRGALATIASTTAQNVNTNAGGYFYRHDPQTPQVRQFLGWNVFGRGNRLPV